MTTDETNRPDIVYLDPMYPSPANTKKAAQVKKGMQYVRALVASDPDDVPAMLASALQNCTHRVVLKRPVYATALGAPVHSYAGVAHRFDAYMASGR